MRAHILLTLATLVLIGCSKKPETLVESGYDVAAMEAAMTKARSETDQFVADLQSGKDGAYSVKVPITDSHGTEHFWITDVSFRDGSFEGKIGNEPGIVKNVSFGKPWKVAKDEISDWMIVRENRIHGGYTIDPLLHTMPKEEADKLRTQLVR